MPSDTGNVKDALSNWNSHVDLPASNVLPDTENAEAASITNLRL